jgi:hypothetical protein
MLDTVLKILIISILVVWNWLVSTRLETPYPELLIELYTVPLARILLLLIVILGSVWDPTIGVLSALAYVAIGADVTFFIQEEQVKRELMDENKKASY